MSLFEGRGGIPNCQRLTVTTTGRRYGFDFTTKYIKIRVLTAPCKMYFSQEDFDNDANYVLIPVPAADAPYGEWEGPVEAQGVWLKGVGGSSTVEMVVFQRRG